MPYQQEFALPMATYGNTPKNLHWCDGSKGLCTASGEVIKSFLSQFVQLTDS